MEIIGDTVYLTDNELEKLNQRIKEKITEMKVHGEFNWENYKSIAQKYDAYNFRIPKPKKIVVPMKKQEVIGIAMQYFESLGSDIYTQVVQTVTQQKKNAIVEVYDKHEVQNNAEMNEFEIPRYDNEPSVKRARGGTRNTVYVPLHSGYSKEERDAIGAEATLSDLYSFVHELSHLLDFNPNIQENKTRKFFAESTAIAFEMGLSEFLLEKKLFPQEAIIYEYNTRVNNSSNHIELSYMILKLIDKRNPINGITNEALFELQEELRFKPEFAKYLLNRILNENVSLFKLEIYGTAGMLSPTISQKLRNPNEREKIIQYLECVKSNKLDGIFEPLGLEGEENDCDIMFKNMQEQLDMINGREKSELERE